MPCACGKDKNASKTYTVLKGNGSIYKTYSNKLEADAAAARIGGRVKK
jgi:hypothetical protein